MTTADPLSPRSAALARLRDYFQDDLFVRSPGGLQATRLCERLAPEVQAQLQLLEAAVTVRDQFDPAHSDMRWRLSLSDLGEMMFLPPLAAALRQQAPQAHLTDVELLRPPRVTGADVLHARHEHLHEV